MRLKNEKSFSHIKGQPAGRLTGAEGQYPGETPSRVPVKSNSGRSGIVWNIELGTVRDPVKRNGEDLESIQRCMPSEERTRRMGGKWQGRLISLQGSGVGGDKGGPEHPL